jgi:predicted RNA polymerase sigma factor
LSRRVDRRGRGASQFTDVSIENNIDAWQVAEFAARTAYGKLLAYLIAQWRDVASAEDALSDAFLAALEKWPRSGVPNKPEAWLLTAARRRLVDHQRHKKVAGATAVNLRHLFDTAEREAVADETFPDERLKLLFVCAHPAIDEAARTPLMLQTALGLDAARIASAFVVAPAAMSQRLVRVKAKIRDAGIRFAMPEAQELSERLGAVLEAIYAAYSASWDDVAGADARCKDLTDAAIWLGRLVARLMPAEPEAQGLLALMLHCEARRVARRDSAGAYVPLAEQDVTLWSRSLIEEAEMILSAASRANQLGRFQLEAAIQSVHAQRVQTGRTDWRALELLYEGLIRVAPTIGARVAHAAALAEAQGAGAALADLDAIAADLIRTYQPYWALKAHVFKTLGRAREAEDAYSKAIGLSEDAAVRAFLLAQSRRS